MVLLPHATHAILGVTGSMAEGLWSIHTDFFEGYPQNIGNRTLIVQLAHALAIINATPATESSVALVRDLEAATDLKLEYILTTGDWHYLRMGEWMNHFPTAKAYIPAGRLEKRFRSQILRFHTCCRRLCGQSTPGTLNHI
ncbi:hypothetical protein BJ741DRAFT_595930 [Chytriomyces cf. hyalinus JEL632]|nr:hypothetical protein BJ741DRAFT_595930 [Chytriomyces cf. hyalinus JEL632]